MTTQEEKELLLEDLCGRLPYGVKILYKGWDSDHGCEFNTVEDLIGIDDRFIHTLWRGERDKHSIVEPLSITDYKPYLRPLSSMTEEEKEELRDTYDWVYSEYPFDDEDEDEEDVFLRNVEDAGGHYEPSAETYDWYNRKMFDYRELIQKGLALEAPNGMYNN
jgi:hypothetical protein